MIQSILNWFKRLKVIVTENGHVYHFGDGKDFILIKENGEQNGK